MTDLAKYSPWALIIGGSQGVINLFFHRPGMAADRLNSLALLGAA